MKSVKQAISENQDFKTLINAVINRVGLDNVEDINRCGINAGFPGRAYYSDTHAFAMRHRKAIIELLENDADQFGQEIPNMVGSFGAFRSSPMDADDKRDLYKYLGGGKCEKSTITNLMAWYAAETVCRWFED